LQHLTQYFQRLMNTGNVENFMEGKDLLLVSLIKHCPHIWPNLAKHFSCHCTAKSSSSTPTSLSKNGSSRRALSSLQGKGASTAQFFSIEKDQGTSQASNEQHLWRKQYYIDLLDRWECTSIFGLNNNLRGIFPCFQCESISSPTLTLLKNSFKRLAG